jgi:hypothetical protein
MASRPASSPWLPAFGWIDTRAYPVTSASQDSSVLIKVA